MLTLDELKRLHDKAYNHGMVTRERASDDMVFYWVTQWDDNLLGEAQLQYRGEFNILRKAGRQIASDLRSNPVQVIFEPIDETPESSADLVNGLYLSDDRPNASLEAYDNAKGEALVCGVGAWRLVTEYESNTVGNDNQKIVRKPVYEANNNLYWDPNAKMLDKSDAKYCSLLESYTEDGYKALVKNLTGEELNSVPYESFKCPEESYTFPWAAGQNESIYVATFYHCEEVSDKIFTMVDPFGQPLIVRESDMEKAMDELLDSGYMIGSQREIVRTEVTEYIASGREILQTKKVAGPYIPIIPTYGERAFVEGEEHYEGITRLSKDPSRLRNFMMSYLADIVSRSPRPKPIFNPEQIAGFEFMYEENGPDNNYPYALQNSKDSSGNPLPQGPVGILPDTAIPQALAASVDLTREAVEDVANPGLPQDIADPDVSGKAVIALQSRLDMQSQVYQENFKHAKRRDGEIYAAMSAEIVDSPRKRTLTMPDGTQKKVNIMEVVQDRQTGEMITINDLTNSAFDVYADIGPSYSSKKEQTIDQLGAMAQAVAQTDPLMHKALVLKQLTLMDGVNFDDIRDYANKQLVMNGFKQPETSEEEAMLAQASESAPDPAMVLAQAEIMKGKAQMMREQRQAVVDQAKSQNDSAKTQIDFYKAQTDRAAVEIDAQKANADIQYTNLKAAGQQIDNVSQMFRARVS